MIRHALPSCLVIRVESDHVRIDVFADFLETVGEDAPPATSRIKLYEHRINGDPKLISTWDLVRTYIGPFEVPEGAP